MKVIIGLIIGIVFYHCVSNYTIVSKSKIDNTDITFTTVKQRNIDTRHIPDSWKSTVEDYWRNKNK